jgi:hypothetical protein
MVKVKVEVAIAIAQWLVDLANLLLQAGISPVMNAKRRRERQSTGALRTITKPP